MNDHSQTTFGKISVHGDGMGAPTPELVEKRAREIALIDERDPENFSDADWDQAQKELMGVEDGLGGDTGERAPRDGVSEDDETIGERLVSDGLEEAAHDQMVSARHEELEQEGGVIEGA